MWNKNASTWWPQWPPVAQERAGSHALKVSHFNHWALYLFTLPLEQISQFVKEKQKLRTRCFQPSNSVFKEPVLLVFFAPAMTQFQLLNHCPIASINCRNGYSSQLGTKKTQDSTDKEDTVHWTSAVQWWAELVQCTLSSLSVPFCAAFSPVNYEPTCSNQSLA